MIQIENNAIEMAFEADDYGRDLKRIAKENGLWAIEVVGIAMMMSLDIAHSKDIKSVEKVVRDHITNNDGSDYELTSDEIKYANLVIKEDLYNKYKK